MNAQKLISKIYSLLSIHMPGVFLRLKSHGTATFLIQPLDHYSDLLRAEPTNFSVFTESEKVSLNHIVIVVYLSIFLYVLTPEGGASDVS